MSDALAKLSIHNKSAVHKRVLKGRIVKKRLLQTNAKNFQNAAHVEKFKMKVLKKIAKLDQKQSRQEINMHKEVVQKFAKKYDVPLFKLARALKYYGVNYKKMKYLNGFASATPSSSNNNNTPTRMLKNMKLR